MSDEGQTPGELAADLRRAAEDERLQMKPMFLLTAAAAQLEHLSALCREALPRICDYWGYGQKTPEEKVALNELYKKLQFAGGRKAAPARADGWWFFRSRPDEWWQATRVLDGTMMGKWLSGVGFVADFDGEWKGPFKEDDPRIVEANASGGCWHKMDEEIEW